MLTYCKTNSLVFRPGLSEVAQNPHNKTNSKFGMVDFLVDYDQNIVSRIPMSSHPITIPLPHKDGYILGWFVFGCVETTIDRPFTMARNGLPLLFGTPYRQLVAQRALALMERCLENTDQLVMQLAFQR